MTSPRQGRTASWLLLIAAGPLAVSVLAVAGLSSWTHHTDDLTQKRTRRGSPAVFAAELSRERPDVVVVGNSISNAAILPDHLAEQLGDDTRISMLTAPGSMPPTWFLVLKNQVFTGASRPHTVVLANPTLNLLETQPASELQVARMAMHRVGDEPELMARLGIEGSWSTAWWTLGIRRTGAKEAFLGGARDLSGRWLGGAASHDEVETAFAEVFADPVDADDFGLGAVIHLDRPRAPQPPSDSFLVEIADVVEANGARLVVTITPTLPPDFDEPAGMRESLTTWTEQRGIDLFDLTQGFGAKDFRDPAHLLPVGATRFTAALGAAMLGDVPQRSAIHLRGQDHAPTFTTTRPLQEVERAPPSKPIPWVSLEPPSDDCVRRGTVPGVVVEANLSGVPFANAILVDGRRIPRRPAKAVKGCAGTWSLKERKLTMALPAPGARPVLIWAPMSDREDTPRAGGWAIPGATTTWLYDTGDVSAGDSAHAYLVLRTGHDDLEGVQLYLDGRPVQTPPLDGRGQVRMLVPFTAAEQTRIALEIPPDGPAIWIAHARIGSGAGTSQ